MSLIATKCPSCGGEIQLDDEKKSGFCLYCGSKIDVQETLNPKVSNLTGSDADVEKWKAVFDNYLLAFDYKKAEQIADKILQAQPKDRDSIDRYNMIKTACNLDIDGKGHLIGFKKGKYNEEERIVVPHGVVSIAKGAFKIALDEDDEEIFLSVNELIIPESVEEFEWPICDCGTKVIFVKPDLYQIDLNGNVLSLDGKKLYFCSQYQINDENLKDIESIENHAFFENEDLYDIVLPIGIKRIGAYAFYGCSNLTKVETDGVEIIEYCAFITCSNLTKVKMDGVEIIEHNAFSCCDNLIEVEMDAVKSIGCNAFYSCSNLLKVKMDKVQEIGGTAFQRCRSLTEVKMDKVQEIGEYAFSECSSLREVMLPMNTNIGDKSFDVDTKIRRVTPEEIEIIKQDNKRKESIEKYWQEHSDELAKLSKKKEEAQSELNSLGIFSGKRKKELEAIISEIDSELKKDR